MNKTAKKELDRINRDIRDHEFGLEGARAVLQTLVDYEGPDVTVGTSAPGAEQAQILWDEMVDRARADVREYERSIVILQEQLASWQVAQAGYSVGDIVVRRSSGRKVLVVRKLADVKNGLPGYEGRTIFTNEIGGEQPSEKVDAWGYDEDLVEVVKIRKES